MWGPMFSPPSGSVLYALLGRCWLGKLAYNLFPYDIFYSSNPTYPIFTIYHSGHAYWSPPSGTLQHVSLTAFAYNLFPYDECSCSQVFRPRVSLAFANNPFTYDSLVVLYTTLTSAITYK